MKPPIHKNGLNDILLEMAKGLVEGIGFAGLGDLLVGVLALKYWLVWVECLTLAVTLTVLALNYVEFVEANIYAPEFSLRMYNIAIGLNILSGVAVAIRVRKERADISKIMRGLVQGLGLNAVLMFSHNMGKASEVYLWLPVTVWTLFIGVNFLKWLRNMALLGWIGGEFKDILENQFSDKYQIKLKPKKEDGEISDKQLEDPKE